MKNTTTFLFLFFAMCKLHSQDYTLSFTGSGESTLVDSVYVENLTQGTFISIPNGFNLHLLKTINGVDEIHKASNQELAVTNNGQNNSITIEFEATANAQTNVELHDLSGKMQAQHQIYLNKGKHCFDIDGLNSGLFIITVRSKEFYYSGKVSISAPASSEIKIFNHRRLKDSISNTKLKGLKNEIQMQYNQGERLRFTGRSGLYSTVCVLVPTADGNIHFDFVPCTDGDNNNYSVVKIGNQIWMAENFKSLKTANGQIITEVYAYADNLENTVNFGRLYTWQAAVNAAPQGWHLPSKEEWQEMINLLGGANLAGGKLKETGTFYWNSPNTGATNSVGFSAIAGGFRGGDGVFYDLREHGSYWGSANNTQIPYCIYLYNTSGNLIAEESPTDLTSGIAFAVRYIRD